jgi:hypothetical protein
MSQKQRPRLQLQRVRSRPLRTSCPLQSGWSGTMLSFTRGSKQWRQSSCLKSPCQMTGRTLLLGLAGRRREQQQQVAAAGRLQLLPLQQHWSLTWKMTMMTTLLI